MSRALHRRLLPILAFMLVVNAVASPLVAHAGTDQMGATSQEHGSQPCHENETSDPVPSSHHSGSLDCCAAAIHCGCMSLPAGSAFASAATIAIAGHDPAQAPVATRAPQTGPDSFLRPPIS